MRQRIHYRRTQLLTFPCRISHFFLLKRLVPINRNCGREKRANPFQEGLIFHGLPARPLAQIQPAISAREVSVSRSSCAASRADSILVPTSLFVGEPVAHPIFSVKTFIEQCDRTLTSNIL
jgi:hypothetical protein